MPTGAGKSLCYMLPSLALPGLTVVVSPLIALMQDQLRKLPLALPGACLSGSLTAQQMMQVLVVVCRTAIYTAILKFVWNEARFFYLNF